MKQTKQKQINKTKKQKKKKHKRELFLLDVKYPMNPEGWNTADQILFVTGNVSSSSTFNVSRRTGRLGRRPCPAKLAARSSPLAYSEDGVRLPMWRSNEKRPNTQSSHPVKCTCQCPFAYSGGLPHQSVHLGIVITKTTTQQQQQQQQQQEYPFTPNLECPREYTHGSLRRCMSNIATLPSGLPIPPSIFVQHWAH